VVSSRSRPSAPRAASLSGTVRDREEAARLAELRAEARYRRERLDLYRARLYGGRARSHEHLRGLQRSSAGAAARL
jgi:hypothetical protein